MAKWFKVSKPHGILKGPNTLIDALLISCPFALLLLFRSRRAVVARVDQAGGDAGPVIIFEEDEASKFDVRRMFQSPEPNLSAAPASTPDLARSGDYVPSVRFFATMAPGLQKSPAFGSGNRMGQSRAIPQILQIGGNE
jgi:hypothetical protein